MPLSDASAVGLDPQVRGLEPGRPQAISSSRRPPSSASRASARRTAMSSLGIQGGAWGGVYYSPVCGAGSRAFEAVEPGLEAEWVRAPAGSPPAGVALGPSLRGRRISSK